MSSPCEGAKLNTAAVPPFFLTVVAYDAAGWTCEGKESEARTATYKRACLDNEDQIHFREYARNLALALGYLPEPQHQGEAARHNAHTCSFMSLTSRNRYDECWYLFDADHSSPPHRGSCSTAIRSSPFFALSITAWSLKIGAKGTSAVVFTHLHCMHVKR